MIGLDTTQWFKKLFRVKTESYNGAPKITNLSRDDLQQRIRYYIKAGWTPAGGCSKDRP
jgi:hypothetical protein